MSKEVKIFGRRDGKVLHEFNCSNCCGYITVKLDMDKNGAHCVVCPNCDHKHYRIIKDGVITEDRAPSSAEKYADEIHPMKSAYSKTSWEQKLNKLTPPNTEVPKKPIEKKVSSSGPGSSGAGPVEVSEHPQARSFLSELWQRSAAKTIDIYQKVVSVFKNEKKVKKSAPARKKSSRRKPQVKSKPKVNRNIRPTVESLLKEIERCKNEKERFIKSGEYESAAKWRDQQRKAEADLLALRLRNSKKTGRGSKKSDH